MEEVRTPSREGLNQPDTDETAHALLSEQQEADVASSTSTGPRSHRSRRRGLGMVTPIACTECRNRRAKVFVAQFLSNRLSLSSKRSLLAP